MIFRRLFSGLTTLFVYSCGLVLVAGTWDYLRQAKAADYQYSFAEYPASVMDRYGDEITLVAGHADVAAGLLKTGVVMGWDHLEASGLLETVGFKPAASPGAVPETPIAVSAQEAVVATEIRFAPESSLLPRARVIR